MINKVKKIIREHNLIKKNDEIIVAFSGGADSTFLLYILNSLKDEIGFKLKAQHINHGIRNEEAYRDELFCDDFCKKYTIDFFVSRRDVPIFAKENHYSIEEAGRILRYKALINEEVLNNDHCFVATAHHMNDNVETIIHNLIRGTGPIGLEGMEYSNGKIIRPILDITRDEIVTFLNENKINYVEDSTNDDLSITRNYIRNKIIPELINVNDKAVLHIHNTSKMIRKENEIVENIAKKFVENKGYLNANDNCVKVSSDKFNQLDDYVKVLVIKKIIYILNGDGLGLKDFGSIHFDDIVKLFAKKDASHIDLPYNITIDKKSGIVTFNKNKENLSMKNKKNK